MEHDYQYDWCGNNHSVINIEYSVITRARPTWVCVDQPKEIYLQSYCSPFSLSATVTVIATAEQAGEQVNAITVSIYNIQSMH